MRLITQRVKEASVTVDGNICGQISQGVLVFLGIHRDDKAETTEWLVNKLIHLRQFCDAEGKMNLSLKDIQGEVLIVSQFTLYGDCSSGRRPSFTKSAAPDIAEPIYQKFIAEIKTALGSVQTGIFGAKMSVALVNDGPVTFMIERD